MPSFVGIPLKLQITGLSFDGVALLAYIRRNSSPTTSSHNHNNQKGNSASTPSNNPNHDDDNGDDDEEAETSPRHKIHFCFLNREDARAMLGPTNHNNPSSSSSNSPNSPSNPLDIDGDEEEIEDGIGALLREIRVESEIGRQHRFSHGHGHGHEHGHGHGHGQGGEEEEGKASGHVHGHVQQQQVLKNVGKVEKFVLEQARRILEEEFVWPSFWTFLA